MTDVPLRLAVALVACISCAAPPAPRGEPDAGRPTRDGAAGLDAGTEASGTDVSVGDDRATSADAEGDAAASSDARTGMDADSSDGAATAETGVSDASASEPDGPTADVGADAGIPGAAIVVDGIVGESEWAGAARAVNGVATSWGAGENELRRLRAIRTDTDLFVAVEGVVQASAGNAIVLFVDVDPGSGSGVEPIALTDGTGPLDDAISCGLRAPVAFRPELAWGTKSMEIVAAGFDARIGWRNVARHPDDFAWIDAAEAPSACGREACETRIGLSTLGARSDRAIALLARITNATGTAFSNQCLPEDDAARPDMAGRWLELPPR
ncbi:MAG: hypothetical protein NZ898_07900 [Myxococcota bacterium]|nr:hypothetical protein [Myxococcota bacterium]